MEHSNQNIADNKMNNNVWIYALSDPKTFKPVFVGIEFDMHFDSRRKDLYPACLWALWECVRDFLPDWVTSVLSQVDLNEMKKKVFESRTDGP